jgi:hypothetical protein
LVSCPFTCALLLPSLLSLFASHSLIQCL